MEFIHLESPEDFRTQEIFKSYSESFSADERRDEAQFAKLFTNPQCRVFIVLNDLDYIGYIIAWELSHFIFLEYFEIFSAFRSQKFGSEVLKDLFHIYSKIVLEAEPATLNDEASRRIAFYQRNGFHTIKEDYKQPAYSPEKQPVDLWLMANYHPEKPEFLVDEIYEIVYRF